MDNFSDTESLGYDSSASEEDMLLLMMLEDESDDDALLQQGPKRGGSLPGKRPNKDRRRQLFHQLLYDDYWGANPTYDADDFRRRFRMPIGLFNEIVEKIQLCDSYFVRKRDACRLLGFSALQKVSAAIRMLATGIASDMQDDHFRMGESTGLECLQLFCAAIDKMYGEEALRAPTVDDLNRILDESLAAGWPGCLGSIDCMHWAWKNCPSGWKGMFKGKESGATVVLEAIADHSCRFWHFFFGMPGSLNDINVLDRSPLHKEALKGKAPQVTYQVNGYDYHVPYWLADGIYPAHHCFVKSIHNPTSRKQKLFSTMQEAKRKDIERAFGILQSRFHVLTTGCRFWSREFMHSVIKCCVILHNLIIDYEREHGEDSTYINDAQYAPNHPFTVVSRERAQPPSTSEQVAVLSTIQNPDMHRRLRNDLMSHLWEFYGAHD
jgi:hypothetical protein